MCFYLKVLFLLSVEFSNVFCLKIFNCSENATKFLPCEISSVDFCQELVVITNYRDVIRVADCNMPTLEASFMNQLNNVNRLSFQNVNLTSFRSKALIKELVDLWDLYILDNHIRLIQNSSFKFCPKVKYLNLEMNDIEVIEESAFYGLDHIESLSLKSNKLTELDGQTFISLKSLQILNLNNNSVESLTENVFLENRQLTDLRVNSLKLKKLAIGIFRNNLKLLQICIQNSSLEFFDTYQIQVLILMNNNLTKIRIGKNTINANFNYNRLAKIECDPVLNMLYFTAKSNKLRSFQCIKNMKNVNFLILSFNQFEFIPQNTFDGFDYLNLIDLSHNHFRKLMPKEITALTFLMVDFLSNYTDIINLMPNVREISISMEFQNCSHLKNVVETLNSQLIYVRYTQPKMCNSVGNAYSLSFIKMIREPYNLAWFKILLNLIKKQGIKGDIKRSKLN
jgi:hypothetical protein